MQVIGYVTVESVIASPLAVSGVTNAPFVTTAVFQIAPAPSTGGLRTFVDSKGQRIIEYEDGEQQELSKGLNDA